MIVTWTTLRTRAPSRQVPWEPSGAAWWQAGPSGPGRAEPPAVSGRWWSVLAAWPDRGSAEAGPAPHPDLEAWHVVLEAASRSGDVVLAGGARPFAPLPAESRLSGAVAVVTVAGRSPDSAREREFVRRFLQLGRDVARAPGHVAALVSAPADGPVVVLSAWRDLDSALDWSYARPLHAGAVSRQRAHGLVETSGSLRCAVLSSRGRLGDLPDPLAGLRGAAHSPVALSAGTRPAPRPGPP